MSELLQLSVGLGLAVSLLCTEVFGLAAGGMIVPGYMALNLRQPLHIAVTLLAALITYAVVHAMSAVLIVYGRRRTTLMILMGYLVGYGTRWLMGTVVEAGDGLAVIGFIIPGLIAIWFERQGVVETLCALLTSSVMVRLLLVIFAGRELLP